MRAGVNIICGGSIEERHERLRLLLSQLEEPRNVHVFGWKGAYPISSLHHNTTQYETATSQILRTLLQERYQQIEDNRVNHNDENTIQSIYIFDTCCYNESDINDVMIRQFLHHSEYLNACSIFLIPQLAYAPERMKLYANATFHL